MNRILAKKGNVPAKTAVVLLKCDSEQISTGQKEFVRLQIRCCTDRGFFPHKLFAGSEGSLGLVTSAKFKILDLPLYRNLLVLAFEDLITVTIGLPIILSFGSCC